MDEREREEMKEFKNESKEKRVEIKSKEELASKKKKQGKNECVHDGTRERKRDGTEICIKRPSNNGCIDENIKDKTSPLEYFFSTFFLFVV